MSHTAATLRFPVDGAMSHIFMHMRAKAVVCNFHPRSPIDRVQLSFMAGVLVNALTQKFLDQSSELYIIIITGPFEDNP